MAPVSRKLPRPCFFALEAGGLPSTFARLALPHAPEKAGIGAVQIAQRFLRRTLGDFVQPGSSVRFSRFNSRCRSIAVGGFSPLLGRQLARQTPVVGKTRRTGVARTQGPLCVVQGQFGDRRAASS